MSDDIPPEVRATALRHGVDPWALLGVDRAELAEQLAALARVGVAPERVASVAVLGA